MSGETEQDSAAAVKSAAAFRIPHCVIDGFLDAAFADQVLAHLIANERHFATGGVLDREGSEFVDQNIRSAQKLPFEGHDLAERYAAKLVQALPQLCEACGVAVPEAPIIDIDAAVYRDGGFYTAHVDTLTHAARDNSDADRILSLIFYIHRHPAGFSGGEIALYPIIGDGGPALIGASHNRLVAFPSYLRHEVRPVSVPGNGFADARFAINCWVLRHR